MSSAGDDRWQTVRGQQSQHPNQSRQQGQGSSRGGGIGGQPQRARNSSVQGLTAMSGNAWVTNDRASRDPMQHAPAQEQHVALNGFNAQDARDSLKNAFASANKKTTVYKGPAQPSGNKSGAPWATKPNTMGNGKDFFLELRKQISAIQQNGPERAGFPTTQSKAVSMATPDGKLQEDLLELSILVLLFNGGIRNIASPYQRDSLKSCGALSTEQDKDSQQELQQVQIKPVGQKIIFEVFAHFHVAQVYNDHCTFPYYPRRILLTPSEYAKKSSCGNIFKTLPSIATSGESLKDGGRIQQVGRRDPPLG
ncbi:MAG: hypothetical protein Q9183_000868 [Haloplaca sp. 2 TL-2023]